MVTPLNQTRRKWRVAATSVQFLTLLLSLTRKTFIRKRWRQAFHAVRSNSRVSPADIVVVDVPPATTTISSFNLTQAIRAVALVRDKNLDELQDFGHADGVIAALYSHAGDGISGDDDDLVMRREAFGCNVYLKFRSALLINLVRNYMSRSCKDVVLYVSFVLSFGIRFYGHKHGWKEGGYMLLIAFVYSVFSSVLDFGVKIFLDKSISLATTRMFECSSVFVVRGGSKQLVPVDEIVVGDVIVLKVGENVPADGLLVDENPLMVSELNSVSNNETEVNSSMNPFLFSGSRVITGTAKMVVTAVGTKTRLWERRAAATVNHNTALQVRVQNLMSVMKKVNLGVALVVLVIMLARYFCGNSRDEQGNREFNVGKTYFGDGLYMIMRIILVSITIALAMDSESFLWVVKICQGYTIKKMAADGILVRKLSPLEIMGSVTSVVVTEKTDELTPTQLSDFQEIGVRVITVNTEENYSDEEIYRRSVDLVTQIQSLKQSGHVVALLTRDNDEHDDAHTLALEEADVRLLVSSRTNENQRHKIVQAESYDVLIINFHHFPSVIKLLIRGRCILDNTRKLIQFQLTAGAVSLLNSFIYTVSQSQTPIIDNRLVYSLLQLVWVNLVLAFLAAIVLSREQPCFKTRQMNNKKRLIYGSMWRNIAAQVVYQTIVIQVIQFKGESIFRLNETQNDTMSFVVFFYCQVFNMFNARKVEEKNVVEGIKKNKLFMGIVVAIIVVQLVFVEILHKVVDLERLDWKQRLECVGLSSASLVVGVVMKLVPVGRITGV